MNYKHLFHVVTNHARWCLNYLPYIQTSTGMFFLLNGRHEELTQFGSNYVSMCELCSVTGDSVIIVGFTNSDQGTVIHSSNVFIDHSSNQVSG